MQQRVQVERLARDCNWAKRMRRVPVIRDSPALQRHRRMSECAFSSRTMFLDQVITAESTARVVYRGVRKGCAHKKHPLAYWCRQLLNELPKVYLGAEGSAGGSVASRAQPSCKNAVTVARLRRLFDIRKRHAQKRKPLAIFLRGEPRRHQQK